MGGATSRAQVQHEKDEQAEAYGADPSKGRRRGSGSRAVHDFNMIHVLDRSDEGALTLVRARDGEFSQAALCMREFRKGAVRSRLDAVLLERDILTGIPSPFLPAVVKAFEEVHSVFMVTKFYSGGPLKEHLRRNPKGLEPSRAAYYVACIGGAIAHLHSHFVMHRGVCPAAVLMDGLGHVVLSGFENARRFTPGTFTNTLFGTEGALRAPEVGEHEGYNESVDVWALGVLTHQLLTGDGMLFTDREGRLLLGGPAPNGAGDAEEGDADHEARHRHKKFVKTVEGSYVKALLKSRHEERPEASELRKLPFVKGLAKAAAPAWAPRLESDVDTGFWKQSRRVALASESPGGGKRRLKRSLVKEAGTSFRRLFRTFSTKGSLGRTSSWARYLGATKDGVSGKEAPKSSKRAKKKSARDRGITGADRSIAARHTGG